MPADIARTSSGEYVRSHYGVPAFIKGRVVFNGKPGVITGFTIENAYVLIRLDGETNSIPVHPTWRMTYLPVSAPEASDAR